MKKKEITKFPQGFFQIKRPTVSLEEALEDVIPLKWIEKRKISSSRSGQVTNK